VAEREAEERREVVQRERQERLKSIERESHGGAELNERLTKKPRMDNESATLGADIDGASAAGSAAAADAAGVDASGAGDAGDAGGIMLPVDEVKTRLRSFGQPVTYFGESDRQRYDRLRKIETEGAADDDFAISGGHGTRNIFLEQDSRRINDDGVDDDDDDDDDDDHDHDHDHDHDTDDDQSGRGAGTGQSATSGKHPGGAAANDGGMASSSSSLSSTAADVATMKTSKEVDDHRMVRDYFKGLLREWELALQARPDHIKRTAAGKIDTKTQKQAKDYIRPLFKLCKKRDVPPDILLNLVLMIKHMKDGEFVKANDAYILTAIGNAAWPIGVTSVGIHQRTAHDKMQTGKVAHVMNNEAQRKYLQSVKRLMKFEQNRRHDVPPSKKVN
jgi:pre-mRNA-splicing factor 18